MPKQCLQHLSPITWRLHSSTITSPGLRSSTSSRTHCPATLWMQRWSANCTHSRLTICKLNYNYPFAKGLSTACLRSYLSLQPQSTAGASLLGRRQDTLWRGGGLSLCISIDEERKASRQDNKAYPLSQAYRHQPTQQEQLTGNKKDPWVGSGWIFQASLVVFLFTTLGRGGWLLFPLLLLLLCCN